MNDSLPPTGVDYEAIRTFQAYCHSQSRARGFHDEPDRMKALTTALRKSDAELADYIDAMYYGNRLMLISGEVAEAHEEVRAGHALNETYYSDSTHPVPVETFPYAGVVHVPKPEGVPSELGDIFIRLMDLAEEANIDLAAIIQEKLAYNSTREFKHGKAF